MNIKNLTIATFLTISTSYFSFAQEESTTAEKTKAENQKHIAIVAGTPHYSPAASMPMLKQELEKFGFKVTLISPEWNTEKDPRGVPGLEILADADVTIFFIRWLQLKDEQLKHITDYVEAGKPVVGLRTTGHGFNYPKEDPRSKLNVGFGKDVLGSPYLIHLAGSTQLKVNEDQKDNPILTGISGSWKSPGTLYLTKLEEGVTPLITGTGKAKRTGTVTNMFGTHELQPIMSDTVAWTWTNKHGGKAFYTSLGHTGDFAQPNSMRLMINGIHWAADAPIPSADTEISTYIVKSLKKKKRKKQESE